MILRRPVFTKPVLNHNFLVKVRFLCSTTLHQVNPPSGSVADRQTPLPNYSSNVHLSPLVNDGEAYVGGCNIELVDNDTWQVSSGLAQAWRGLDSAIESNRVDEEGFDGSGIVDEGDSDFDEIDNMRVRGNLFYKLDRNSKEYEEYSFEFHRRKGSKEKCKQSEKKESLNNKNGENDQKESNKMNPLRVSVPRSVNIPRIGRNDEKAYTLVDNINYSRAEKSEKKESLKNKNGEDDHHKESNKKNLLRSSVPRSVNISRIARDDEKVYTVVDDINYSRAKKNKKKESLKNKNGEDDHHKENNDKNPLRISVPGSVNIPRIARDEKVYTLVDDINYPRAEKTIRTPTFNQLTGPYHEPFCLDIFISNASVRACIIHRATSKVVAVAHSISKDLKFDLGSTRNIATCASVGGILAQRALADDIHNIIYTPRKGDKLEGKLLIVLQAVIDNGVNVKLKLKQRNKKCSY